MTTTDDTVAARPPSARPVLPDSPSPDTRTAGQPVPGVLRATAIASLGAGRRSMPPLSAPTASTGRPRWRLR
jgi:hypothetical protein